VTSVITYTQTTDNCCLTTATLFSLVTPQSRSAYLTIHRPGQLTAQVRHVISLDCFKQRRYVSNVCLYYPVQRNYIATSNNMKLVHWPLMGGLLHLVQRGGDWVGPQPAEAPPRCTKCNSPPINSQYTNHHIATSANCV